MSGFRRSSEVIIKTFCPTIKNFNINYYYEEISCYSFINSKDLAKTLQHA